MAIDREQEEWDGDLHHVSMRTWMERDSDVVAVVAVLDGEVHGWTNLRHVNQSNSRIVWLWIRHAAWYRPPVDVLWASDLAKLAVGIGAEEA